MLIVNETTLHSLMQAIASATHGMVDLSGTKQMPSTADDRTLRMAALSALMQVVGHPVWPGDRPLILPKPRQAPGPVRYEE